MQPSNDRLRDHPVTLPAAMTGRTSPAKAAVGDQPVFAYIASLPNPQRGIAEAVDALAARTLPDLQRSVKWGMSYHGVGDGWCFSCGGFASHVKLNIVVVHHPAGLTRSQTMLRSRAQLLHQSPLDVSLKFVSLRSCSTGGRVTG